MSTRRHGFLADPFGVFRSGEYHFFFEDFDYVNQKGRISCVTMTKDGEFRDFRVAMDLPFHMAYPYVFEHNGEILCIPETQEAREVALYRAERFPDQWTKVTTLIEGMAGVDATLCRYGGRWWLFCGDHERDHSANLFIWHTEDLWEKWQPHVLNPVKTNVRSARPAGTPFVDNDILYRPAQDLSETYGGRIVINRVTELSPEAFHEEPAAFVDPERLGVGFDGTHTLAAVGAITVVDAKKIRFVRHGFSGALRRHAAKVVSRAWSGRPGNKPAIN